MENHKKADIAPCKPQRLLGLFRQWGISFDLYEHEPLFTVEDTHKANLNIPGHHCRNLYLRDKKKNNYLVVLRDNTEVDMKNLADVIGSGRLSFGSASRLWDFLGVRPGSVCPFAAINDKNHEVKIILEKGMMECDVVDYHPLINTMTVALKPDGLRKFFTKIGRNDIRVIDLTPARPK